MQRYRFNEYYSREEEDDNGDYVLYSDAQAIEDERDRLRAMTACTMGVGNGDGKLFVHGDYESIKAAQEIILERVRLKAELAEREKEIDRLRDLLQSALPKLPCEINEDSHLISAIGAALVGKEKEDG